MNNIRLLIAAAVLGTTLTACGGGGGGGPVAASKAEVKAYLFCAMSSNSKIVSIESALTLPAGLEVPITQEIGDDPTVHTVAADVIASQFFTDSATFNQARSVKYSLSLASPFPNISSSKKGNGKEIATLNFPLTVSGVNPTTPVPVADPTPTIGKIRNNNGDFLDGCIVNYVTTYK